MLPYQQRLARQPRVSGGSLAQAVFRSSAADFRVDEILGFDPEGRGDHVLLQVQKTRLNTQDIVQRLVEKLSVRPVDIGYAGLKDKHAVTRQWLSVHVPGRSAQVKTELISSPSLGAGASILTVAIHHRKLRIGSHARNRFALVLRQCTGDLTAAARRCEHLRIHGFPNYFGPQRFGWNAGNVSAAHCWLQSSKPGRRSRQRMTRTRSSLLLSSARAFLFNEVLAARISAGNWLVPQPGEALVLEGTRSFFMPASESGSEAVSDQVLLQQRINALDLHTSGVMWGTGQDRSSHDDWERKVLSPYSVLATGLESHGLSRGRRALRAVPRVLEFRQTDTAEVALDFELPAGCYATALLREIFAAEVLCKSATATD